MKTSVLVATNQVRYVHSSINIRAIFTRTQSGQFSESTHSTLNHEYNELILVNS